VHVSGLFQLAAKLLYDYFQTLIALEARNQQDLLPNRRINGVATFSILKPLTPSLLLGAPMATLLADPLAMIAKRPYIRP
jgi:hypothetical protein